MANRGTRTIYDGPGVPRRVGDVAIQDGKISAVGEANGNAATTIEAKGRVVAPGFVYIRWLPARNELMR